MHCAGDVSLRHLHVGTLPSPMTPLTYKAVTPAHLPVAKGATLPGYLDDPTVPPSSRTPTFAACAVFINNARWDGVPFLLKAGKALHRQGGWELGGQGEGIEWVVGEAHTRGPSVTPLATFCRRLTATPYYSLSRVAEIRVQFRHVPGNLYRNRLGIDLDKATNELVIRIQARLHWLSVVGGVLGSMGLNPSDPPPPPHIHTHCVTCHAAW